jgi:hypothetical protein
MDLRPTPKRDGSQRTRRSHVSLSDGEGLTPHAERGLLAQQHPGNGPCRETKASERRPNWRRSIGSEAVQLAATFHTRPNG